MTKSVSAHKKQFTPVLSIPVVNCLSWEKGEIRRFQAKRFVFAVQLKNRRHKIFQIVFGKSDGSIYVTFPYFDIAEGIVSIGTIPASLNTAKVNLESGGKVTSKRVKYTHHPDGEVHFSQTGKVLTSIRRKSLPLERADGHLFSVQAQGFSHFETVSAQDEDRPKMGRTVLNFKFDQSELEAIKMIARWYKAPSLMERTDSRFFGPIAYGQTPDGRIIPTFLIGAPSGWPMDKHVLLLSCEAIPQLDNQSENALIFIGGFDPPEKFNDIMQPASFLCVSYPAANYEELIQRIGTIDIGLSDNQGMPPNKAEADSGYRAAF